MSEQAAALPRPRRGRQTNLIAVATLCSGSKKEAREEKKGTFMPLNPHQFPYPPLVLVHCSPALNHVAKLPGSAATREEEVEERRAAITEEVMRDFLKFS